MTAEVAGDAIAQLLANVERVFDADTLHEVYPDVPAPRVTLDLPGAEPEPLHVFVWGTARDFGAEQFVTGAYVEATFHLWVTAIASASTSEEAARIANAYQSMIVQCALVDPLLGGTASDAYPPEIKEADAWADASGRRHAGYLIDLGYSTIVSASQAVARALGKE